MMRCGFAGTAMVAMALAGCSVSTSSFNDPSGAGGAVVGTLGSPVPPPPPAPAPSRGAFLQGPAGQRLAEADRDHAYQAELDALSSGARTSWRGSKGTFGYVAPAAAGPDGCRAFTHTIYIGGRPVSGGGSGCPQPGGAWVVAG